MQEPVGILRERRAERDRVAFRSLVATPAAGALTMPANGRIYFRSVAGCAAGTVAGTAGGRTIQTPLLPAGGKVEAGFIGRALQVSPALGFDVLVDMGLGRYRKIGGA